MKRHLCILLAAVLMLGYVSAALAETYPEGVLYRGIKGHKDEVEGLQYYLFYLGYLGDDIDAVDGIFGKDTEAAVKAYQEAKGLYPDGVVWPETQTQLDADWEIGLEPQGGENDYEEPVLYCYVERYANGTQSVVLCSRHMQIHAEAADAVRLAGPDDEDIIEGLQIGITFWMEEMKSLYQQWADLRPEYAQQITTHQEAFMDYYRAQLAVWNAHFGSPSMAALEKAMEMLAEHCSDLCIMLSGAI